MYQNVAKMVQKVSVHPSPSSPIITILHYYGTLVATKEVAGILLLTKLHTLYSDFTCCYLMSFLCSRSLSRSPHYIQLSYLLRLLWSVTISHTFFLFLMTLTVWRSTGQIFFKKSINLSSSDFFIFYFFAQTRIMSFGEEDHRGAILFSSYHSNGPYYHHDLSLLMLVQP